MNHRLKKPLLALGIAMAATSVTADSVTGSNTLLCTADHGTRCYADGECMSGPPWQWDVPKFIEIDLKKERMVSTRASAEALSSPIGSVERDGAQIYLQGVENSRAYSMVIDELTGVISAAIVLDGVTLTVFGACTPLK